MSVRDALLNDARLDVMDRQEREDTETYNQGTDEVLDLVAAEVEIRIRICKLCKRKSCLLFTNRTPGEIGLAERTRGVHGVIELDPLAEALDLAVLNASPKTLCQLLVHAILGMQKTYCLTLSIKSSLMP